MSKTLASLAMVAALATVPVIPEAQAGPRHHYRGHHHSYHHHRHHHGRGYWRNGKWIALGVLGAAVGAAIADSRDCYYRHGRRYCYYAAGVNVEGPRTCGALFSCPALRPRSRY
jgi:hypothetical protein